jgi:acylglycerol lipase
MESLHHITCTLPSGAIVHTWSPSSSQTLRATIVLQHGFGEYAERYVARYNELIPRLVARGFEIKALDFMGHGRSPGIVRGVCDIRKAVQDHLQIRRNALQERKNLPMFLVGHSLGGLVTAGSVAANGENVRGVILMGPAFAATMPSIVRYALAVPACLIPSWSMPLKRSLPSELSRIPEIGRLAEKDPMMSKQSISYLLAVTALDITEDVRQGYATWEVPTLVMRGTADNSTDAKACKAFIEGIKSKDKKMSLYEGGKHELLNDLPRDEALNEILDWLEVHLK